MQRPCALPRVLRSAARPRPPTRARPRLPSSQLRAHRSTEEYKLTLSYFWPRVLVTSVAWGLSGFAFYGQKLLQARGAAAHCAGRQRLWLCWIGCLHGCLPHRPHTLASSPCMTVPPLLLRAALQARFIAVIVGPDASLFTQMLYILLNNAVALVGCEYLSWARSLLAGVSLAPLHRLYAWQAAAPAPAHRAEHSSTVVAGPRPPGADYAAAALIDRRWFGRVRMQALGFAMLLLLYLLCGALYGSLESNSSAFQVAQLGWAEAGARPAGASVTLAACPPLLQPPLPGLYPPSCPKRRHSTTCPASSTSWAPTAPPFWWRGRCGGVGWRDEGAESRQAGCWPRHACLASPAGACAL